MVPGLFARGNSFCFGRSFAYKTLKFDNNNDTSLYVTVDRDLNNVMHGLLACFRVWLNILFLCLDPRECALDDICGLTKPESVL